MTFPPEIQKRLEQLRLEFVAQSRSTMDELAELLPDGGSTLSGEAADLIRAALHDLKGQAATFGFPTISDMAKQAERFTAADRDSCEASVRELGSLFASIRGLLEDGPTAAEPAAGDRAGGLPV